MQFEKLDLNDKAQKEFFERVYNASFPDRERRPLKYLYPNHTGAVPFTLYLIWDGEGTAEQAANHTAGHEVGRPTESTAGQMPTPKAGRMTGRRPEPTAGRMVGLIGSWEFPALVYGEYFAVDPDLRGEGIGQRALALWLSQLTKPALIEVEPPVDPATGREDPLARRRIEFYARNGLKLWDEIDYIQPTYHYNGVLVPMRLMTFGGIDLPAQWERLRVPFFREVYGVREEQIPEATGALRHPPFQKI